jgi:thiamine kinase-like enzyme
VTTKGIVFLDWEYANVTSPAFDIAVFAATQGLTNQQLETFLDFYGGTAIIASVKYYQRLYGLLEILWWRLKTGNQEAMESALAQFLDER